MGKVLTEARGDVQEAIGHGQVHSRARDAGLFGETVPSELRDKWAMTHAPAVRCRRLHHPV